MDKIFFIKALDEEGFISNYRCFKDKSLADQYAEIFKETDCFVVEEEISNSIPDWVSEGLFYEGRVYMNRDSSEIIAVIKVCHWNLGMDEEYLIQKIELYNHDYFDSINKILYITLRAKNISEAEEKAIEAYKAYLNIGHNT